MESFLYHIIDIFFVIFHTTLIIFNLFGWIWKKTRFWNLMMLLITGASWVFLGLIVGTLGYCPCTDWHFRILEKLGRTGLPNTYIKYLADRITGLNFDAWLIDQVTLYSFVAALGVSLYLNIRDRRLRKKERGKGNEGT
jgi:hypothetical protein